MQQHGAEHELPPRPPFPTTDARLLQPASRLVDYTPNSSLYEEPALLPPVNPDSGCIAATHDAVSAARSIGLEVIASVIGCHNTTIGLAHPELCVENAFGDRYAFALCPAQPRVRTHLCSVVRDVSRQLRPDAVWIDSFAFLDAVPTVSTTS